jgi:hypothetical protein
MVEVMGMILTSARNFSSAAVKVKLFRYMPWRHVGGEDIQLLLMPNLGTRWGF